MNVEFNPKPPPRISHPAGKGKSAGNKGLWCSYCGHRIFRSNEKPSPKLSRQNIASQDHILPRYALTPEIKAWMDADCLGFGPVTNLRWSCQLCNGDRASVGHCPGALAAARAFKGGVMLLRRGKDVTPVPRKVAAAIEETGFEIVSRRGGMTITRKVDPVASVQPKAAANENQQHEVVASEPRPFVKIDNTVLLMIFMIIGAALWFALGIFVGYSIPR